MIYQSDKIHSEYYSSELNLKAQVIKVDGCWGGRFWKDQVFQTDELYSGHSESYAEDACENYVLGIKKITL
jgi:hypothetical protein